MPVKLYFKIVPSSSESKIEGNIIKVKSSPKRGRANLEIVKLLCRKYKKTPDKIKIIGKKSNRKRIIIYD